MICAALSSLNSREECDCSGRKIMHRALDLDFLTCHQFAKGLIRRQFCHGQLNVLGGDRPNERLVFDTEVRSPVTAETAGWILASNCVRSPNSTLSISPLIAPQSVCPRTKINFAPTSLVANSKLPRISGLTMLPAILTAKMSPICWSKMSSGGNAAIDTSQDNCKGRLRFRRRANLGKQVAVSPSPR